MFPVCVFVVLPSVGETVPQTLSVAPQQPVEDAVEEPVQVEALYVRLPPDPLQRGTYVGSNDVQHLSRSEVRGQR